MYNKKLNEFLIHLLYSNVIDIFSHVKYEYGINYLADSSSHQSFNKIDILLLLELLYYADKINIDEIVSNAINIAKSNEFQIHGLLIKIDSKVKIYEAIEIENWKLFLEILIEDITNNIA